MEPKKFLFVGNDANIGDAAWHIKKEGHEVKYFIKSRDEKEVADGFVEKTGDWKKETGWADVVIFDDVDGLGAEAEKLRKKGKLVIGGTAYTDMLEGERAFGQEEMKKSGISILPYKDFNSFDDAIEFVKEHPGKYVIKPNEGKEKKGFFGAEEKKGLLFVGEEEDGKDVLQVLEDYKKAWSKRIPSFQLQKRVIGVEVAVGAFFNGKEFAYPINVNFEHKRLFPGNIGPSTGEMGTTMFWSEPNKIFNQTLKKIEPRLAEEGYVGYIDLNCIVNNYGIYPLEFTARFGYPTISIQMEGLLMPMGEFMYELAKGSLKRFKTKTGFQVGVRIVVPPFPFNDKQTFNVKSKDSVIFFKKGTEGIHIEDIKLVNDEWVVTGNLGAILIVCGTGQTMKQAQSQAYSRIKNIIVPHMYYRTDIGDRWLEDSDRLHTWDYLREN